MVLKFSCSESRFLKMGVLQLTKLIREAKASKDVITLEATVITGFELQAADECKEKCKPVNVVRGKGRIFFNIKKDSYPSVFKLRAVDNVFIVSEAFDTLKFTHQKENDVEIIKDLVAKVDWAKSVPLWAELTGFKGILFPKCAKRDPNEPLAEIEPACQRCLTSLNPPENVSSDGAAGVELLANPSISVDDHSSPQPPADLCEKESCTITEMDGAKLKAKPVESDDEGSFHSAEEDNVECESNVKVVNSSDNEPVKTIEASKCIPDSSSGGEISEDVEDLPVQSDEVSESPDPRICKENQHMNSSEEEKLVKDLCQKSELLSVSDGLTESPRDLEKTEGDGVNSSKTVKKMSYWQRRKAEQKEGKGKKKVPKPPPKPYIDDGIIKFRATCYRSGKKHSFDSNAAAMHFGGQINDDFHWTVDLTRWDINVVLVIEDHSGYVTFGLTKESFHRRNIQNFGPTTLRSTLCYSLLRYAEPRTGDIVIDPLCGGGSISIEGAKGFPKTFHLCGDNNEKCVERTKGNLLFNTKTEPLNMDAFRWNAKALPLKDQSVDIVVTDLPFGLRMGKWKDNNALYDAVLRELARVVRSGSGRAALLTYDKAAMIKVLRKNSDLWREIRSVMVNHGGIRCVVFLLLRKAVLTEEQPKTVEQDTCKNPINTDNEENNDEDVNVRSVHDVSDGEAASSLQGPTNKCNEPLATESELEHSVLVESGEVDTKKPPSKPHRKAHVRNKKGGDNQRKSSIDENSSGTEGKPESLQGRGKTDANPTTGTEDGQIMETK
uniref:THUMP domain-containing protein 3 n=1 Tax=Lygus hesperus TaxID=30085 RepID=A0A0A9XVA7_LYGHE